ncbi:AAA family ATPase [Candidatus Woesearchaeota archaeon]|nr:AAA family ATPase [Candidatus Woesearchaeota archaeon]
MAGAMRINSEFERRLLEPGDCFPDIIGQGEAKRQLRSALLMSRHVIIIGPPGVGKTTLAKNVARLLPWKADAANNADNKDSNRNSSNNESSESNIYAKLGIKTEPFVRVQGSPDLTGEDLIGDIDPVKALEFGPASIEAFTPGKIFRANGGVLFFDELNRCPEKVQNSLLQALEEKEATIGSYSVDIDADFIFIGTMNPQDTSTEKLSDVFIDRFDIIQMGYPESDEIEERIVVEKGKRIAQFSSQLLSLAVGFVRALRENRKLAKLPSVRAAIGLYERSQANALIRGSNTVSVEDIRNAAVSVLAHRMELKPSAKFLLSAEQLVRDEFSDFMKKGGYR